MQVPICCQKETYHTKKVEPIIHQSMLEGSILTPMILAFKRVNLN